MKEIHVEHGWLHDKKKTLSYGHDDLTDKVDFSVFIDLAGPKLVLKGPRTGLYRKSYHHRSILVHFGSVWG